MKSLMVAGTCMTLLLFVSGCMNDKEKNQSTKSEQVFRKVESNEVSSIDPSLAIDSTSQRAVYTVYEGLYRLGEKNELLPAGAVEAPEISADGLTYKIKLNTKSIWSDDVPVKASDYVFSWRRTVDPKTTSEGSSMFLPIKNAKKIIAGQLKPDQLGIRAIGDDQLEITLEEATPYFETLLVNTYFFPQREDTVERYGESYGTSDKNTVYNGAFVMKDYEGGGTATSWSYQKNEKYWDAENVHLEKIENTVVKDTGTAVNMYEADEVDEVPINGESVSFYKEHSDFSAELRPNVYYLDLNQKSERAHLDNVNLRKAISYSIDRKSIVENILNNDSLATNSFVPSKLAYSPIDQTDFTSNQGNSLPFDNEEASDYWEKFLSETDLESIEVELLVTDTESSKKMAEYIQGQLQNNLNGMIVTVTAVPYSVMMEKEQQDTFDIALNGWGADYLDPMSYLNILQSDNFSNYSNYSNKEYDELIDKINASGADPKARWKLMLEAEKKISEEVPVVPLFQYTKVYLRRNTVHNVHSMPLGLEFDYKNIEIN
ncbi:peptide ABC transporter substrate-binding protein [Candidatus Enterococcus clewellii]|uniref:Oligopeptide transport system substrate-binding protein n=2 Tax=Candidatus Enterococcus clewellii TaxID=1834193 RepID=A0AAQ3VWI0_9ENTE